MADSKITALTAISTVDPTADPLVIVDVSDTSMAASGTTKKSTINQLLGSGGTATLASATITGDLTVDTSTLKVDSANNRVGIVNATPLFPLDVSGSGVTGYPIRLISSSGTSIRFDTGRSYTVNRNWIVGCDEVAEGVFTIIPSTTLGGSTFTNPVYRVSYDGIHTFLDGAGGTRMTLNSTGLGVGIAPASSRLSVYGTGDQTDENATLSVGNTAAGGMRLYAGVNNTNEYVYIGSVKSGTGYRTLKLQPNGGNAIICLSITPPTLSVDGDMVFNLTSNTNLRISVRGTDGTTRTANITLA